MQPLHETSRTETSLPTEAGQTRIGTAGWSVPSALGNRFPSEGTHLERYAPGSAVTVGWDPKRSAMLAA